MFKAVVIGLVVAGVCVGIAPAQTGDPPTQSRQKPAASTGETRKAVITSRPAAEYTRKARAFGVEGSVLVKLALTSSGEVTNITIVEGLPHGLNEEAVRAARKIKFEPAVKDGRRVSQWVVIRYTFTLY